MNQWPNQTNYLRPSFNPPVDAPDVDPDTGAFITVKYNPEWTSVLLGAVTQMLQFATWNGSDDDKKLATARALLLMTALQADTTTTPTPYWDDDEDVGDEEPADMQTWYGQVTNPDAPADELDFVENAIVWFFTGLLAIASAEIAFAPAILFHTLAPRFIIAMRTADVAEVFRIVVNGQDYAKVDTTGIPAGTVINQTIIVNEPLDLNTLIILAELL